MKNPENMKIAVLMGGCSSERTISLRTGAAVEASLKRQGLEVIGIDVDDKIAERLVSEGVGVVFLALHGRYGEDGSIQGILEFLHIPYTGSGILASALAFHKTKTKYILSFHQIPTPRFISLEEKSFSPSILKGLAWSCPIAVQSGAATSAILMMSKEWNYPVVVKPCEEGSTIGISIVRSADELEAACLKAFSFGQEILIEEFIDGREVTVGILGDQALPVVEVVPLSGFYDFESKYTIGKTEYIVPAPLDKETYQKVQEIGLQAHRVLGCRGVSRVDLRIDHAGNPFVLEINTIPGMTETSLLPKAAKVAGISFEELVRRILFSALK